MFIKLGLLVCLAMTFLSVITTSLAQEAVQEVNNERYETLKSTVFAQPYEHLPTYRVSRDLFGKRGKGDDNHLLNAARRTLQNQQDLIDFPQGQKLLQANGICFDAKWRINENSAFTGLLAPHSSSPAIVRASVALSGTLQKHKRAFGMAIKLLPDDLGSEPSLNVFVLNSMGGAISKHILDLPMDNQPPLGRVPNWSDIRTALRLKKDLEQADKDQGAANPRATFRSVSHLAEYRASGTPVSPKWLRLTPKTTERINKDDFREELRTEHYSSLNLHYFIEVAADDARGKGKKSKATWQTIGVLTLLESVTSASCDQKLHFQHPK